ncbi:MAG TPA: leucyl aminopeptidase [Pyrinomonadaceae bacterium]|nr:leucyl aminopeptidase [Pyrinomonadaceae bacterium]
MNLARTPRLQLTTETPPPAAREPSALLLHRDAPPHLSGARGDLLDAAERLLREGDFDAKEESLLFVRGEGGRALLLVGMGAREEGETADTASLRRAAGAAVRRARDAGARVLHLFVPVGADATRAFGAVAEGVLLGSYVNDFYRGRGEDEDEPPALEEIRLVVAEASDALREELRRAVVVAESANWARSLADEPGGSLPPRELARRAAEMAAEFGLKVESLDAEEIRARGMGGLLGVGQGSEEEPALVVVRYEPEGAHDTDELWAFVGKGITFDTGGISLKRGPGMEEMKSDMAGGAAVLGALRALAQLRPARRVVGVVPSAENMPSGRSIKPGDIVRTFAGHTIEVVDTDAEGRLVLADGLAYARSLGASRLVDLATLTGSIIVALGTHRAGLFSNDDEWAERVRVAAERAGEPVWRMPVGDDYKKLIESPIADFKNYGGRPDATSAALLLSKFADPVPWAHLDIAGTAWHEEARADAPKGATGAGVRTLVELVCR